MRPPGLVTRTISLIDRSGSSRCWSTRSQRQASKLSFREKEVISAGLDELGSQVAAFRSLAGALDHRLADIDPDGLTRRPTIWPSARRRRHAAANIEYPVALETEQNSCRPSSSSCSVTASR
ncbi:MAG: hypothetical protein R2849_05455 [Thermomicrobiales bacterium]